MSSIENDDFSCRDISDKMTCGTMTFLSKREAQKDARLCGQFINTSYCSKYQTYPDELKRFELQANGILSKNICFNPNVMIKEGEWLQQFGIVQQTSSVKTDCPCFTLDSVVDQQQFSVQDFAQFDVQTRPR